ncbi:MAG: HD domain-containing protein [Bacillota bacterium]|nr:HD domain-containing protein [Bacillota bacterium]MDP4158423.1 HD domain-containing protein [Bacillota bacterium]
MKWNFIHDLQRIYAYMDCLEENTIERDYPLIWERIHATSCAQIGRMLAEMRGVDTELAAITCALHDMGRWVSGRQNDHAPKGEEPVRRFLMEGTMDDDTREQIVQAVINHSKKDQVGSELEEIVKDADILDCYWYGEKIAKVHHAARLQRTLKDLGIHSLREG